MKISVVCVAMSVCLALGCTSDDQASEPSGDNTSGKQVETKAQAQVEAEVVAAEDPNLSEAPEPGALERRTVRHQRVDVHHGDPPSVPIRIARDTYSSNKAFQGPGTAPWFRRTAGSGAGRRTR